MLMISLKQILNYTNSIDGFDNNLTHLMSLLNVCVSRFLCSHCHFWVDSRKIKKENTLRPLLLCVRKQWWPDFVGGRFLFIYQNVANVWKVQKKIGVKMFIQTQNINSVGDSSLMELYMRQYFHYLQFKTLVMS